MSRMRLRPPHTARLGPPECTRMCPRPCTAPWCRRPRTYPHSYRARTRGRRKPVCISRSAGGHRVRAGSSSLRGTPARRARRSASASQSTVTLPAAKRTRTRADSRCAPGTRERSTPRPLRALPLRSRCPPDTHFARAGRRVRASACARDTPLRAIPSAVGSCGSTRENRARSDNRRASRTARQRRRHRSRASSCIDRGRDRRSALPRTSWLKCRLPRTPPRRR